MIFLYMMFYSYRQSSNMLNQARLKALKVREDHVRNVLEEARKRLGEVTQNTAQYREILQLLIIQGLYQVILS
jgi:V-type H+-transporting ATPase subunit E